MKHLLFNLLTTVSLLLCLATGALSVRSFWVYDRVDWFVGQEGRRVTVAAVSSHYGAVALANVVALHVQ